MLELIGLFVVRVLVKLNLITGWLKSLRRPEQPDPMQQRDLTDSRLPTGEE